MLIKFLFLTAFLFTIPVSISYSQDGGDYEEISQEEWEFLRDQYAVKAIILITQRDSLNYSIDSLTAILSSMEKEAEDCEADLYSLVGTTRLEIAEFRRKFEETEKKINNRNSTPEDIRSMYYDEISNSKITCLPEFSDRFTALRNKMETGTEIKQPVITEGSYLVVKGDCLWSISRQKLGNPLLWPVIWDMNRTGVINKSSLPIYQQTINNPDLIYPGQVLRIPASNEVQTKLENSIRSLRKKRIKKQS